MFLYQKVFESLKQQIISGEYPPGSLLPSEREIGEIYQVDRTTVRKAFQFLVDEKLVEKHVGKGTVVIYQPDDSAVLPAPQNGTIAFLLPKSNRNSDRITVPFYSQLFYGVEKQCKKAGYSLIYSTLDEADDLKTVLSRNIANLKGIMFVSNISEKHIDQALENNIPSILINGVSDKLISISSDNFTGTYTSCEHLIGLGHKNICVLNGIKTYHSAKERLTGVRAALKAHNLSLPEKYHISNDSWEFEGGFDATQAMLSQVSPLPTAIIAFNDRLANGALQAIQQAGLNVPEDISVIGFDNSDQARYSVPKLSSVEINIPTMAKIASANLFYQIGLGQNIAAKILVPVYYIERDSVKFLL